MGENVQPPDGTVDYEFVSESTVSCAEDDHIGSQGIDFQNNDDTLDDSHALSPENQVGVLINIHNQPPQGKRRSLSSTERARLSRAKRQKSRKAASSSTERSRRSRERLHNHGDSRPDAQRNTNSGNASVLESMPSIELASNDIAATAFFQREFIEDEFGHECNVCERLWFKKDLKKVKDTHCAILGDLFGSNWESFMLCGTCSQSLDKNKIPTLSVTNGFRYPPKPQGLPNLNPISIRLISPRIPFMNIRRLQRDGNHGIVGQVINVPIDVNSMVRQLPRHLDDDHVINVSIKRKLFHKSSYLCGAVKKDELKAWLDFLVKQPLYISENIKVDWQDFDAFHREFGEVGAEFIEDIADDAPENVPLMSRQQTLLWNEENTLDIAPGQYSRPLNLIFDIHAEELSFPMIYYGVARSFNPHISITPFMIASSEIRRKDRRGANPEHILYMAMTILRRRVVDGMRSSFRRVLETEGITRRMLEDRNFRNGCVAKNLAFLKSIPNSSQYWQGKKHDLFAMIRQLGKPTIFLTLSANEVNWPHLLIALHKLNGQFTEEVSIDSILNTDRSIRSHLVNEDPVTCCIYFKRLIDVLLRMLKSDKNHNPFGPYKLLDYFMRIEFQHRGSPHAHILMWLDNDPKEEVSENMPGTIQLMNYLCSVSKDDIPGELHKNQVHRHTFTCTKRGETSCRFHIPFWPVKKPHILLPLARDDSRRGRLKATAAKIRKLLEEKVFASFDIFLNDTNLDYEEYLDVIRSTIKRPTFFHQRDPSQVMTNAFNPWLAKILMSNMDIQIILDIWSCANYIVEYVNKTGRGLSNLHRELIKLSEQYPEIDKEGLMKKIASKVLNSVEMSSSEGAWYLLRQPMSQASRETIYIPTCHPAERHKSHKTKSQLEEVDLDSTDVWTTNIIQKYESRPENLENICLADFAALYSPKRKDSSSYSRRKTPRIIRSRNYDASDADNFKREMVTLYIPFRNEQVDVLDNLRYLTTYTQRLEEISSKRQEYEKISNLEQIVKELQSTEDSVAAQNEIQPNMRQRHRSNRALNSEEEVNELNNPDGFRLNAISAVRRRRNVLEKAEYCRLMRTTNTGQRRLLHHAIHLLTLPEPQPLQVFFTGPAGCGKTYVLKLLMDTYNRYSQQVDERADSYLACASTGKAAVNLGGMTVHSALQISSTSKSISFEGLHKLRSLYGGVNCVIVDEVSMIGSGILHQIHERLCQIARNNDELFGAMSVIFCGDFKQLSPVLATPVYKASRNHLHGNLLWQSLEYHCLDQVMRQSDAIFSSILTKIGNGFPLTQSESQVIESRFREESWCKANLEGVIRLYHENHLVNKYNEDVLSDARILIAEHSFTGYSSQAELTNARSAAHKCPAQEAGGLAYQLLLKEEHPYMITMNIDVEDGLANGAIGKLKYIEDWTTTDVSNGIERVNTRVWIEFDDRKVGSIARSEKEVHMQRHSHAISAGWTPIDAKTSSLNLSGSVRCRRTQLPLVPACAITIHKAQGGTFDRAVFSYQKNLSNQLVYVALSRVKSLDGLFLTNPKNDFVFYAKNGCNSPTMKEIRDEYERLSRHKLKTKTDEILEFINCRDEDSSSMIVTTINAQSLVAHYEDIQTDEVLMKSDFLVITETWMDDASIVSIENFNLVSMTSSYRVTNHTQAGRTAGGVAIYVNKCTLANLTLQATSDQDVNHSSVGDASIVRMNLNNGIKFTICGFYIHPESTKSSKEQFIKQVFDQTNIDNETIIMVTGDFNSNISSDDWLLKMIERDLNLTYVPCDLPTTLGNTRIDLTFVRGMTVSCRAYIAYFSYHRPLVHKLHF